ncbi:MAG: hypothetical protein ABIY52_17090 [Gemmatimonadaceae bacterium]
MTLLDRVRAIPSLWRKTALALGGWLACELVSRVMVPMPDPHVLGAFMRGKTGFLAIYDMFSGGAIARGSVFALGIMPYASARIFTWGLERVTGRKLTRWTRGLTAVLSVLQAWGFANFTQALPGAVAQPGLAYTLQTIGVFAGVAIFMGYVCEQVTEGSAAPDAAASPLLGEGAAAPVMRTPARVQTPLPR